jgi:hypothetical protein
VVRRAEPEADAERKAFSGLIQVTKKENRGAGGAGSVSICFIILGDLGLCIIAFSSVV